MGANYGDILRSLEEADNLRILRDATPDGKHIIYGGRRYLNVSSNDYLGIASRGDLQREFLSGLDTGRFLMGNPASRLMTGNSVEYRELEDTISGLYGGRGCLVFGSGYHANSAILPALTSAGDVILADKLVHASIIDGLRLSGCTWERYRHNDTDHLEILIKKHRSRGAGEIWVATESVFSMDGDRAPIIALAALKNKYGLRLYLDEAHAFGVFGTNGSGLADAEGCGEDFDVVVGTLGKAAASQGGFVICSEPMRQLLVNRARTLIFSTALPPVSLSWSGFVVSRLPGMEAERRRLTGLYKRFENAQSQIIPVMAYGNRQAGELAAKLRSAGYWVTPVRYPTVPEGQARVRLSLTAAMETAEIEKLAGLCKSIG